MAYSDFKDTADYLSKVPGAEVEVLLIDERTPDEAITGATTSLNFTDNFETIPIEEGGKDGVDEHVQGRHDGGGSIAAFFSPKLNDRLPTRQSLHPSKTYTVISRIGPGFSGAGTVLDAMTGCKINRVAGANGARGAKTLDIGFVYQRRYNGQEWADLTGA